VPSAEFWTYGGVLCYADGKRVRFWLFASSLETLNGEFGANRIVSFTLCMSIAVTAKQKVFARLSSIGWRLSDNQDHTDAEWRVPGLCLCFHEGVGDMPQLLVQIAQDTGLSRRPVKWRWVSVHLSQEDGQCGDCCYGKGGLAFWALGDNCIY